MRMVQVMNLILEFELPKDQPFLFLNFFQRKEILNLKVHQWNDFKGFHLLETRKRKQVKLFLIFILGF